MNENMVVVECERNLDTLYRILCVMKKRYPVLREMRVKENGERWRIEAQVKCSDMDCQLLWKKLNAIVGVEGAQVYSLRNEMNTVSMGMQRVREVIR